MTDITEQQRRDAIAQVATVPVANGSRTLQQVIAERYGTHLSLGEVLQQISSEVQAMADGDVTKLRELLAMQTLVLDQVFNLCVERGVKQHSPKAMQTLLNTALRAQGMSRLSIESMAQLATVGSPADKPVQRRGRVTPVGHKTKQLSAVGEN